MSWLSRLDHQDLRRGVGIGTVSVRILRKEIHPEGDGRQSGADIKNDVKFPEIGK